MKNYTCVKKCGDKFFVNEDDNNICKNCFITCLTCENETECLTCINELADLEDGNCIDECEKYQFLNILGECKDCHSSCIKCLDESENSCITCENLNQVNNNGKC